MTQQDIHKQWQKIGTLDFICFCKFMLLQTRSKSKLQYKFITMIEELWQAYKEKKGYK